MEGKEKKGEKSQWKGDPRGGRKGKKNGDRGWKQEAGQPGRPPSSSWEKALPHFFLEPEHTSKTNLLIQQHHHGAGETLLHFKIL